MSFLANLADQISNQLSLGTNETQGANGVVDGSSSKYSSLGDYSKSSVFTERRYVEEGYLRIDPYSTDAKRFEVLLQEPNATVLLKKRMFSSVGDNYRPDYMNNDEKLYYKATKILFQNKCNQIAALEKLSKIAKITQAVGNIDEQLIPLIITLTDQLNYAGPTSNTPTTSGLFGTLPDSNSYQTSKIGQFTQVIDKLREVYAFNRTSQTTSWLVDSLDMFQSNLGQGTGVIEITNFTNLSTTTTVEMESGGSFSLSISDPYELMLITDWDIEIALSDATNMYYNSKLFQFGTQAANNVIQTLQAQLSAARSARNASPLNFMQEPNTVINQPLTVIVQNSGQELVFTYNTLAGIVPGLGGSAGAVMVGPEYLQGGAILGYDGLSSSELSVFQSLVAAIYNQQLMTNNSQSSFTNNNQSTNYARRKLRFNYSGQVIVQPMDVVHIYISSKSRYDSKIMTGLNNLMSGFGILQSVNNTTSDFVNTFNTIFQPANSIPLQLEKAVYVGPTFPNFLWSMLRTQFVTEKEGCHVFAGLVENASDDWSDGHFNVEVRGRDQSLYFEQGKVNFKPGADTFNGAWFDPLTPFQTNFDSITADYKNNTPQLLPENVALLSYGGSGAANVRKKLGPWSGTPGTSANIIDDRTTDPLTGLETKTFYAPDGLVYVWREGIGVFTQSGLSGDINDPNRVGKLNVFQEPFAGQDIMNVISLLITGVPYNYTTFYQGVLGNGKFGMDQQSGENPAFAFINSLNQQLSKNNTLWGNFIPFKTLSVDEKTYATAQFNQFQITKNNALLDTQLQQLQTLQQQSQLYTAIKNYAPNISTTNPSFINLSAQIQNLSSNINQTVASIQSQNQQYYSQAGNDPSFNTSDFISSAGSNQVQNPQVRQQLRRQINYITRRMSYDVRANQDKNYFIVDDAYDKDYDILAFEQSINNNMKPWNNEFLSVKEKITSVAKLLNLEVFCDTQGHVRARPPQYNRMPSSVFYRMMYLKQVLHVQVFPDYLNQLFTDQISTLKTQVEILEDEIRLDCDILAVAQNVPTANISTDQTALSFINSGASNASGNAAPPTSNTGSSFNFLSDRASGTITDLNAVTQQANPDVVQSQLNTSLASLQPQANITNVFNNSTRVVAIQTTLSAQQQALNGYNTNSASIAGNTDANMLIQRIQTKSGQKLSISDYITSAPNNISAIQFPTNQKVDVFKLTSDLQDKISKRQQAVKLLYSSVKNAAELKSLDNSTSTSSQYVSPNGYGNSNVPEVFANMIEDETYDDYGPGSGTRYIIRRAQIKNIQISANAPPWTSVEVHGILSPFLADPSTLPQALNFFPNNGNGLNTAMAIDYDMWRTYGFKQQASVEAPFLNDPQKQCGPYAAMLLSVARKNIFRGSITIMGNEYMQPGEVVFLEDRGMLFYVTSVRHNFSFSPSSGGNFTTTLELSYGHTPGEYIPTTVDFIGKMIYKNNYNGTTVVQHQDNSSNELNLAAFTLGPNYPSNPNGTSQAVNTGAANQTPNPTSQFNSQAMNNLLYMAAYIINKNNTSGNNTITSIEIRTYSSSGTANSNISQFATTLQQQITGIADGPKNTSSATSPNPNSPISSQSVSIVNVNMSSTTEKRSPSQKAWDLARNQVTNSSTNGQSPSGAMALQNALFSYIVDVWLVNNPVTSSNTNTNNNNNAPASSSSSG